MDLAIERAREWIERDPDEVTRQELAALIAANDVAALSARFAGPLEFGTAGLRGVLGAGESRMNLAVVSVATESVCDVLAREVRGAQARGIVIGHDARRGSRAFARATAEICAAHGFKTWLFDDEAPTPLVAFAAQELGTAAAIVLTASHNPPEYNGYKVYWQNGAQIIPPIDRLIREAISAHGAAGARAVLERARSIGARVLPAPARLHAAYVERATALRQEPGVDLSGLRVAYTPMHGVGGRLLARLFEHAGAKHLASVASQWQPDGTFPTVRFPNPEEPGAMDSLLALAREMRADVALANDPDADRLAVAIPRSGTPGDYRVLSGNEVGTLLGVYLLDHHRGPEQALTAASVVSSPELGAIAKRRGGVHLETLTGFKWIANAALAREAQGGVRFLFGYEEALGYTVSTLVRDKDGISAALLFVELCAWLKARGETIDDYQRAIARENGVWSSVQRSIALEGDTKAAIAKLMQPLRRSPPRALDGTAVTRVRDYAVPEGDLPAADMLLFELEHGDRLLVRPSGTEPKVKIYCDVQRPFEDDVAAVRKAGVARAERYIDALLASAAPTT